MQSWGSEDLLADRRLCCLAGGENRLSPRRDRKAMLTNPVFTLAGDKTLAYAACSASLMCVVLISVAACGSVLLRTLEINEKRVAFHFAV